MTAAVIVPDEIDWRPLALCRRAADPDAWFGNAQADGLAAHVCVAHCPVATQCRAYAASVRPMWGVWGGVVWTQQSNRAFGRPATNQPRVQACGEHCRRWAP